MSGFFTPEGVYREAVTFTAAEADVFGRVRVDAILHHFQEIAGDHYTSLGLGRDAALSRGCFWALTRTELQIDRLPRVGEPLWLDTWAGRRGHGLFWRHYRIVTEEGTPLLFAVSIWVIMDIRTRALTKDYAWAAAAPQLTVEGQLPATFRGVTFPEELPETVRRVVTDAETDENGHLNNTLYIPWAHDVLPEGYAAAHTLRSLWIEYRKELPNKQEAELHYRFEGDILYLKGFAEKKECFSLRAEYDSIGK